MNNELDYKSFVNLQINAHIRFYVFFSPLPFLLLIFLFVPLRFLLVFLFLLSFIYFIYFVLFSFFWKHIYFSCLFYSLFLLFLFFTFYYFISLNYPENKIYI